ncbi:MAG: ATP-binding protein [Pseudomonadaceae bacterium]|nr:ATP-binding protein [Pseudomonadaceae bacterium]
MTFQRIAFALVIAFVVLHVSLFWLFGYERMLDRTTEFTVSSIERLLSASDALRDNPELLPLLSSRNFTLSISAQEESPEFLPDTVWHHADEIRNRLSAALSETGGVTPPSIAFTMERGEPILLARIPWQRSAEEHARWLNLKARPAQTKATQRQRGFAVSTTIVITILLAVLWATRRITRHLPAFAEAAEQVGRGDPVRLNESRGPKDLRRLARAFNAMSERVVGHIAERSQMLAAMSHDLRTIITRLTLRAEHIETPVQRTGAQSDLKQMMRMLDEAIEFAKDDHHQEALVKLDAASVAQSVVDDARDSGAEATYIGPDRLTIVGQPYGLRRALDNLVANAIRYGGSAELSLTTTGDDAHFRILDPGPGIPPPDYQRMREPFIRGEPSRNRESGGSGLGLAIVTNVARRHGGHLVFDNTASGFSATLIVPIQAIQPEESI